MSKLDSIFFGVIIFMLLAFFTTCSFQESSCRQEAIKAGMKADDVLKACRR
jgi:hypothetical protein